ncbi:hypothetical protein K402DRAFT_374834 [Aulographum hederae CBS 113979]|uniref:Tc1-like transposase DDE domain-containing protein n=1 Tax=Aulographum hederae CBS 113979 TaxID=1176131 RepID=A0A6G1H531_9PEZI|nr:hypothetical protein K402DRAFT_374834 [Aulographum hederae CBS 113979]
MYCNTRDLWLNSYRQKPEIELKQIYPFKPRKTKNQSIEEHQQEVRKRKAGKPPGYELEGKGNGLSMKKYTEKILPKYIQAVKTHKARHGRAILLEDNDPSHGTWRTDNLAYQAKKEAGIEPSKHTPESPDLNATEGLWSVIKQRLRDVEYRDEEDLMNKANEAWRNITQAEIRARFDDLPRRCRILAKGDGERIRNKLW